MRLNPVKGMRDFPPEEKLLRDFIIRKIEGVFQRFGFDPIETPCVEYWEVLRGKYGSEAENKLIWRFKLPFSEREYALRYDLTVPLARFFARHMPQTPFKRYQIDRVYRYEDPQRGRYREFYQCDVDIIGAEEPYADMEVLEVIIEALKEVGIKNFKVKVNDRRLIYDLFERRVKLEKDASIEVLRVIDKLDKMGIENVEKELKRLVGEEKAREIVKVLEECSSIDHAKNFVENCNYLKTLEMCIDEFKEVVFDASLVRGLDYYTGLIFEVVVEKPRIGSIAGGGRYDNLVELFAKNKYRAVGGSIGIERVIEVCKEMEMFKEVKKSVADCGVMFLKAELFSYALDVARKLRKLGKNVFLLTEPVSVVEGIKFFEKKGIRDVFIVGEREAKEKKVTVQDLEKREKRLVSLEELRAQSS